MDTVSYTLRLPANLKKFMEERSLTQKQSLASCIVAACWLYLEDPNGCVPELVSDGPNLGDKYHDLKMNPAMSAFLGQQRAGTTAPRDEAIEPPPPRPCPKIGFNELDGERYRCRLGAGHKGNCAPGEKLDA